jgi:general stress protein YciG
MYIENMSKGKRGFASMSQTKRSEIAKSGGIAAHKQGKAHQFSHDEAVSAGKKGGKARKPILK